MKKGRLCLWLFGINLLISAFAFGGGYVVVPMIRKYFVTRKGLFTEDDLVGMAAVAQSSPGAIAMNLAALAGYRTAGVIGSVVSCVAGVLPPLLLLSVISVFYTVFSQNVLIAAILKGMQAGVAALIVDVVVDHRHHHIPSAEGKGDVYKRQMPCVTRGRRLARTEMTPEAPRARAAVI